MRAATGDLSTARIVRDGVQEPAAVGACIVYGERLEVGHEAIVTIETTKGERHVGGPYEPVFTIAKPSEGESSGASAYLKSLFAGLFSHSGQTVTATGRGGTKCSADHQPDEPLQPLDRLSAFRQRIGADLGSIVAAWKPASAPRAVHVLLRDARGATIARAEACSSAHAFLKTPPGALHAGDRFVLEIADARDKLDYDLVVVDAKDLPAPSGGSASPWLVAAWRIASGPPDVRLDGLARLQTAPPDALAARALSEAVWSDSKF